MHEVGGGEGKGEGRRGEKESEQGWEAFLDSVQCKCELSALENRAIYKHSIPLEKRKVTIDMPIQLPKK